MKKDLHNPQINRENLRRQDRILAKMRKGGVTEEEIEWLGNFWQSDARHVWELMQHSDEVEREKSAVN